MAALSQLSYSPKFKVSGPKNSFSLVVFRGGETKIETVPSGDQFASEGVDLVQFVTVRGEHVDLSALVWRSGVSCWRAVIGPARFHLQHLDTMSESVRSGGRLWVFCLGDLPENWQ